MISKMKDLTNIAITSHETASDTALESLIKGKLKDVNSGINRRYKRRLTGEERKMGKKCS